jgi:hypothetical protein
VVRYWLEREAEKEGRRLEPAALSSAGALDALLNYKPGAADFIWRDQPIDWYRLELDRMAFESLRVIGGPNGLLWRALSEDGTVMGAARRVAGGDPAALRTETGVDIAAIHEYRESIADPETEPLGPLVVATRKGCSHWYVADGNHRATARGLYLVETGRYDPQPAFLAVGGNRVLRPLYERLCGLVRRLRGETPPFQARR